MEIKMKRYLWILITVVGMAAAVAGCHSKMSANSASAAFASADAATKATWDKAMAASQTNDYAMAIIALRTLRLQSDLTQQQYKALDDTLATLSDRMYDAANRGDEAAKKSVEDLRKMTMQMRGR